MHYRRRERFSDLSWQGQMFLIVVFAILLAITITQCGHPSRPAAVSGTPIPVSSITPSVSPTLPHSRHHLLLDHDPGHVTGTQLQNCHTRDHGQLPDPRCTPGGIDPSITAEELCSPSYRTGTYRPPESDTEHYKWYVAEPAYGQQGVDGEYDHYVSLELGGNNNVANLWVEAGPIPNPKDAVENALHDWVCQDPTQARLRAAQEAIATNWVTAERRLGI